MSRVRGLLLPLLTIVGWSLASAGNRAVLASSGKSPVASAPIARFSPTEETHADRARITKRTQKIAHPQPMGSGIIYYPEVAVANRKASRAINASLKQVRDENYDPSDDPAGVIGMTYRVNHNANNILSVTFDVNFNGAYPTGWSVHRCFLLTTGEQVTAKSIFEPAKVKGLLSRLDALLSAEIDRARQGRVAEIDSECKGAGLPENAHFDVENLKTLKVGSTGITFYFDYGFPHAMKACEPPGTFYLSYPALIPFMRDDGPLADVARAALVCARRSPVGACGH